VIVSYLWRANLHRKRARRHTWCCPTDHPRACLFTRSPEKNREEPLRAKNLSHVFYAYQSDTVHHITRQGNRSTARDW